MMPQTQTQGADKLLATLSKLLALAHDTKGATEAEAANAAAKAQELMQLHGLTLAQVEAARPDQVAHAKRIKTDTGPDRRALYAWQRELMAAVAENNFCLHCIRQIFLPHPNQKAPWLHKSRMIDGKRVLGQEINVHQLVGRELNVSVTVQTYDYLTVALKRAAREAGITHHLSREANDFFAGAATRLTERLADQRRAAEAASAAAPAPGGTPNALVLSDVYGSEADLNNDALNNYAPGTTAARRRKVAEENARTQAEHDRLVAEGVPSTQAWYRAYGYTPERAEAFATNWDRKVRRRSRSSGRTRSTGWTQADREHYRRINSSAYKAGKTAGDAVGLDPQVASGPKAPALPRTGR